MDSSRGKHCRHCGVYKNYTDYHDNKQMRDGKSSYCKKCASTRAKVWKEQNKERAKDTELKSKYGISLVDHINLFAEQGGKCAICSVEEVNAPREILFVDHCHTTGEVRGLLCHHCNSGLGHFMDNPDLLFTAIYYLTKEPK